MPRVKQQPRPVSRRAVQDRPSRLRMLWRRQRRLVVPTAIGLVLLATAGGALALLRVFGHGESLRERLGHATAEIGLRVQQVVIEGRVKTPEPVLNAALGVHAGDPILTWSLADAKARIESIQWVHRATVARRLPGTIMVRLEERRPFAVWQHDGRFVLIDRGGQVVTDSDLGSFASELPLVVGAGAPVAAATLLDALAAQPAILSRVAASVRVGERRWNLRLASGTEVLLPEGAEVQALARLVELQDTHALLDRPLQVIDMRLPDRLVFRPLAPRSSDARDSASPAAPATPIAVPPVFARKPT